MFLCLGGRGGSRSPQTQVLFSQAGMGRREQQLSICQKRRETWILKSARVIPNSARVHQVNAVEALYARISNGRGGVDYEHKTWAA